jgi:ketosteroid isomerase-like protein
VNARDVAEAFARALDADDYAAARPLLAPDCVYVIGDRRYDGPEAILESYRASSEKARAFFDEVVFDSTVTLLGDGRLAADYVDRLRIGERWLDHRARQILHVRPGDGIVRIEDEGIPGERERLDAFLAEAGSRRT